MPPCTAMCGEKLRKFGESLLNASAVSGRRVSYLGKQQAHINAFSRTRGQRIRADPYILMLHILHIHDAGSGPEMDAAAPAAASFS